LCSDELSKNHLEIVCDSAVIVNDNKIMIVQATAFEV